MVFLYLVAIMDWNSRCVLSCRFSNALDIGSRLEVLDEALKVKQPEIFNSDQGSQSTSLAFTDRLATRGVAISMDGRGRTIDNVFLERLWQSVKYKEMYLNDYTDTLQLGESSFVSPHCTLILLVVPAVLSRQIGTSVVKGLVNLCKSNIDRLLSTTK